MTRRHSSNWGTVPYLNFLVGTYSLPSPWAGASDAHGGGIGSARLDTATGQLEDTGRWSWAPNPAYLAVSADSREVWAITETDTTGLLLNSFVDSEGGLESLSMTSTGATGPGHVAIDEVRGVAYVCHFHGGCFTVVPLPVAKAGGQLVGSYTLPDDPHRNIRQPEESRPHFTYLVGPDHLLITDFGRDTVTLWRLTGEGAGVTAQLQSTLVLPPYTGPRHVAGRNGGDIVYISNEKSSSISALRVRLEESPELTLLKITTSTGLGRSPSLPSEIAVDPRHPFVYMANRRDNSLSFFEEVNDDGGLVQRQAVDTRGSWPRHFALSPDGRFLVLGNQDTDTLESFSLNDDGSVDWTGQSLVLASPACIRFI